METTPPKSLLIFAMEKCRFLHENPKGLNFRIKPPNFQFLFNIGTSIPIFSNTSKRFQTLHSSFFQLITHHLCQGFNLLFVRKSTFLPLWRFCPPPPSPSNKSQHHLSVVIQIKSSVGSSEVEYMVLPYSPAAHQQDHAATGNVKFIPLYIQWDILSRYNLQD